MFSLQLQVVPETRGQSVIVLAPVQVANYRPPDGFIDIDELVSAQENDPKVANAIEQGRRLIGETFYSEMPRKLSFYRLAKGWSQKRLADAAKTSQSYIARIEAGEVDPQLSTIKKLADALEVSVAQLVEALTTSI